MANNLDITTLERVISNYIKIGGVSQNVYNNRPKSALKVNDFVVVGISGGVQDMGCYGMATVIIDLFAKDVNNFKNSSRLKYMYDRLLSALPRSCELNNEGDLINLDFGQSDFATGNGSFGDFLASDFAISDFFAQKASYLIDGYPTILGDTPDDYGFTARLINFKVIIKIA